MTEQTRELIRVALGEAEADLAIVNGDVINVYSGEIIKGASVLIKGERIAYVGNDAGKSIGPTTKIIDAAGRTLIPGLIDGHTHLDGPYSISEVLRYIIKGGTTTVITEASDIASPLGYEGIIKFLASIRNQPAKLFLAVPPLGNLSPVTEERAISIAQLRRLLKRKEVIGLGESYWGEVVNGERRILDLIAETIKMGKKVDGHSAGATGKKLQAYVAAGVTSCHEPITAEEVKERVRLGLFVLIREGEIRRELEAISKLKDENINFSRLALSTDGLGAWQLVSDGYMEFVVQKAINLGFAPISAIQMATINPARHFGLDDVIGAVAPGKYADIVIIPDLSTIRAEYVISNGQVVARNGELIVPPRKHRYSGANQNTILCRDFNADDFAIPVAGKQAKVRIIDQVTNLVTREEFIYMPVSDGKLKPDPSRDILKVAAIERAYGTGKKFVGLIRGIGFGRGAIATSAVWDCGDIIVVGAEEADMALAVNRVKELGGGLVVSAGNKILAEIALPVFGIISNEPMETIAAKLYELQRAATDLGCHLPDIRTTLATLTSPAIPFLRICESGLFNLQKNQFVELIVG